MKYWFAENLPSQTRKLNNNFTEYDNPIIGFGCQAIYDSTYELIYFTKKEYLQITEENIIFDPENNQPIVVKEIIEEALPDDGVAVDETPN